MLLSIDFRTTGPKRRYHHHTIPTPPTAAAAATAGTVGGRKMGFETRLVLSPWYVFLFFLFTILISIYV